MLVVTNLGGQYEIPDKMVQDFAVEFASFDRESINYIKDMIMVVFEVFLDEPELLEHTEYKNDLIRAFAMRQALMDMGKFYDA